MHAYSVDDGETTSVPAFQIRWEEEDLSLLETHPLTPGAAATGDTVGGSDNPKPAVSGGSSGGDEGGGGLPTGAVVGIAVGVALLVAIVLISGFLWYRKKYLKSAKCPGQGLGENEKPGPTVCQPLNPGVLLPVYPGGPQEMEASHQFPPPGAWQDGTAKRPAEVQAIPASVRNLPIQQPDGVTSPQHASQIHTSTTVRPSELAGRIYPPGPRGSHQVPELSQQTASGNVQGAPHVAEMHASTVRPVELASGHTVSRYS